jgi:DNA-binding NarL/FixJ family response regulator
MVGGSLRLSGQSAPVRVLVCDDHEVLRHGVRTVLHAAAGVEVVAETGDAEAAMALAVTLRPDVALVGSCATGPLTLDLVRGLTDTGTRVVLLGEADSGSDFVEALRAGARGYVHTTASPERLVEGVRAAAEGETVLDAAVTDELLHRLDGARAPGGAGEQASAGGLTARQQAVAQLVAEGLTNAEIAERLNVSRATVKGHITVALRRLGLRDRTQLAIHVHRSARPGTGGEVNPLSG